MKSDEYIEKYFNKYNDEKEISLDDLRIIVSDILKNLAIEIDSIIKERKIQTNSAMISVFKEQNNKAMAISNRFHKKYGSPLFQKDVFYTYLKIMMPEIYYSIKEYL